MDQYWIEVCIAIIFIVVTLRNIFVKELG